MGNLFWGIAMTAAVPMILARTGNNSIALASTQSAGAIAAVVGGVVMSAWGGFRRRSYGVIFGWMLASFGLIVLGLGKALPIWIAASAYTMLWSPLINGSNQAFWQSKVAPDVQGRVFSARRLIAWFSQPISPLIAGLAVDRALEPAMQSGGALASSLGPIFGTGPGAGMSLLIAVCGALTVVISIVAYLYRPIRDADTALPDFDSRPAEAAAPA